MNLRAQLAAVAFGLSTTTAWAGPYTTFTYQGSLANNGSAANGAYSMRFKLFDALAGGSQVGSTVTFVSQSVADGLFAVELDFGAQDFSTDQTGSRLLLMALHSRLVWQSQLRHSLSKPEAYLSMTITASV